MSAQPREPEVCLRRQGERIGPGAVFDVYDHDERHLGRLSFHEFGDWQMTDSRQETLPALEKALRVIRYWHPNG